MISSMTGFGQSSGTFNNRHINVEIKSLNGKSADIRLKLPTYYKEKELEIRKIIMNKLQRGKMDAVITVASDNEDIEYTLNTHLLKKYATQLMSLSDELNIDKGDIFQSIIKIPNIIKPNEEKLSLDEWEYAKGLIDNTLENIVNFREKEGQSIHNDLNDSINTIMHNLSQVPQHEEARMSKVRERMMKHLEDFMNKENVDRNRYEQEVLHYMERLDINEEKVRLEQHCKYFLEELNSDSKQLGKKLGFIGQEIGREINTMGAKAQFSELQKLVVNMKDSLEKIKEQVANAV